MNTQIESFLKPIMFFVFNKMMEEQLTMWQLSRIVFHSEYLNYDEYGQFKQPPSDEEFMKQVESSLPENEVKEVLRAFRELPYLVEAEEKNEDYFIKIFFFPKGHITKV